MIALYPIEFMIAYGRIQLKILDSVWVLSAFSLIIPGENYSNTTIFPVILQLSLIFFVQHVFST